MEPHHNPDFNLLLNPERVTCGAVGSAHTSRSNHLWYSLRHVRGGESASAACVKVALARSRSSKLEVKAVKKEKTLARGRRTKERSKLLERKKERDDWIRPLSAARRFCGFLCGAIEE